MGGRARCRHPERLGGPARRVESEQHVTGIGVAVGEISPAPVGGGVHLAARPGHHLGVNLAVSPFAIGERGRGERPLSG